MDGWILEVKVSPGAKKDAIGPYIDGVLRVRVTEAPEKGKANYAVISLLSDFLDIPKRDVVILSGETSRKKRVLLPHSISKEVFEK